MWRSFPYREYRKNHTSEVGIDWHLSGRNAHEGNQLFSVNLGHPHPEAGPGYSYLNGDLGTLQLASGLANVSGALTLDSGRRLHPELHR